MFLSIQFVFDNVRLLYWGSVNKSEGISNSLRTPLFTDNGPNEFVMTGGLYDSNFIKNSFEYIFLDHWSILSSLYHLDIQTSFELKLSSNVELSLKYLETRSMEPSQVLILTSELLLIPR